MSLVYVATSEASRQPMLAKYFKLFYAALALAKINEENKQYDFSSPQSGKLGET